MMPRRRRDSRWVHRPRFDWARAERRHDSSTIEGRIFQQLARLIRLRRDNPFFSGNKTQIVDSGSGSVLSYIHWQDFHALLVVANFSEQPQPIEMARFRTYGLKASARDLVKGEDVTLSREYVLEPYQYLWLVQE